MFHIFLPYKNKFLTQKIIDILKKTVKSYIFKNNIISYLNYWIKKNLHKKMEI